MDLSALEWAHELDGTREGILFNANTKSGIGSRTYITSTGLFVPHGGNINVALKPNHAGVNLFYIYLKAVSGNSADVNPDNIYFFESPNYDTNTGVGIYNKNTNNIPASDKIIFLNPPSRIYERIGSVPEGYTQSAGGSFSYAPNAENYTNVFYGDNQAVTITANAGSKIGNILVNGQSLTIPDYTTSYTYNFTEVTQNQTIHAVFVGYNDPFPVTPRRESVTNREVPNDYFGLSATFEETSTPGLVKMLIKAHGKVTPYVNDIGNIFQLYTSLNYSKVIFSNEYNDSISTKADLSQSTVAAAPNGIANPSNVAGGNTNGTYGWLDIGALTWAYERNGTKEGLFITASTKTNLWTKSYIQSTGLFVAYGGGNNVALKPNHDGVNLYYIYLKAVSGNSADVNPDNIYFFRSPNYDTDTGAAIVNKNGSATEKIMFLNPPARIYETIGSVPTGYYQAASGYFTPAPNADNYINVFYGDNQAVTVNANAGSKIGYILVNGQSLPIPDYTTSYTYNFTEVTQNQTIHAVFIGYNDDFPPLTPNYSIGATVVGNGAIVPSGTQVFSGGENQTYIYAPINSDYILWYVQIDGIVYAATDPAVSGGSYTFNNINQSHTITAAFTQGPTVPPLPYDQYKFTTTLGVSGGTLTPAGTTYYAYASTPTYSLIPEVTNYTDVNGTAKNEVFYSVIGLTGTVNGTAYDQTAAANAAFTMGATYTNTLPVLTANSTLNANVKINKPVVTNATAATVTGSYAFTGTGKPGATVTVSIASATPAYTGETATVMVAANGTWMVGLNELATSPATMLPTGTYVLTITQKDVYSNISDAVTTSGSTGFEIVVENTKYYKLQGKLYFDAGGRTFTANQGGSFGTIYVYEGSKTTAESTRISSTGRFDDTGLVLYDTIVIDTVGTMPWLDPNDGNSYTLAEYEIELTEGVSYVLVYHKRNNLNAVVYNVNYTPNSYSSVVQIADQFIYAGDYDTVVDENFASWVSTYGDGIINAVDKSVFVSSFGTTKAQYTGMAYNPYDLDDNGTINAVDYSIFQANYGRNYSRGATDGVPAGAKDFAYNHTIMIP
jgi:hypothetical protein